MDSKRILQIIIQKKICNGLSNNVEVQFFANTGLQQFEMYTGIAFLPWIKYL